VEEQKVYELVSSQLEHPVGEAVWFRSFVRQQSTEIGTQFLSYKRRIEVSIREVGIGRMW
jgi:hypothetical protein